MKRYLLMIVEGVIVFILLLIILSQALGIKFTKKELVKNCQPSNISYDKWEPYCVWLYKSSGFVDSEYYLWIALEKDPNGYGIQIIYPDQHVLHDEDLKNLKVIWKDDSVEIYRLDSEIKISVPASGFTSVR